MTKKLRSLLLAAVPRLGGPPLATRKERPGEWLEVPGIIGGKIQFDRDTGSITDCEKTVVSASIPSEIEGAAVTGIGEGAFEDCACLTSASLPNSVTQIGPYAFCRCYSLTNAALPKGLGEIERAVFLDCIDLTNIHIPGSVTAIRDWAFFGCDSLNGVFVPGGVSQIGSYAFLNCAQLTAFEVAPENAAYCSENGVLFSKDRAALLAYPSGKIGVYEIPRGVVMVEENAFYGCAGLMGVVIPESIAKIGRYAFLGDPALTDVYYAGTRTQWAAIELKEDNDSLKNAVFHYESKGAPGLAGNGEKAPRPMT